MKDALCDLCVQLSDLCVESSFNAETAELGLKARRVASKSPICLT